MKKMIFAVIACAAVAAFAKPEEARRKPAQSGMTIENGNVTLTSFPNQLALDLSGDKSTYIYERIAKKQTGKEVPTNAKVWCTSEKSCSVYWDQ
jgi:hypothetical protein